MPTGTGKKKLKQSRLPFSPIDLKSQKKRKLSVGSENQCAKVLRTEATSKAENCNSPKQKEDIEIIDTEREKVVEEKENLKTKSVEKIVTNVEECSLEDSNDGVEVLEVIEKSDCLEPASEIGTSVTKQVTKQKTKTVKKLKRKRNSSLQDSPSSSIKKLFKKIEKTQNVTPTIKAQNSDMNNLSENKKEVSDKNELSILSQSSEEAEPNVSLESNRNTNTSDTSTPIPATKSQNEGPNSSISKTLSCRRSLVKKNLTPKQKMLDEMKKKKQEERLKLKLQKEQEKKEKDFEKQRLKEEKQRKRIEEQEMKEREKEEKKQKREEERQKREEKKEEERQKKEEERLKKEEEKLMAKEEEREKQKKLKAKFAQFFVPKKLESQNQPKEMEETSSSDNFIRFQVKDNMKVAPVVRRSLSKDEKERLEEVLQKHQEAVNYLQEIKNENYITRKSSQTFPVFDNSQEEEFCEIISDEEIDGTDVFEVKTSQRKKFRAKFLKFCENSRPAYYGTWCKKPVHISGRKPFGKEEIFDYDYDSDEDWEDIENGESLSDSDGEADDGGKEDSNQYEVDNEFFVPHGYLSEGEGEEDDENEEQTEDKEKDEMFQKERLKQKQEEFEMEMNEKTKQLKPKVYGCVWLGDRTSHQAYDQLLKILMPHKAMVMFGTCPVELGKELSNQELKENYDDDGHDDDNARKFVKSFPERAMPDLIRLIHGNRHSKLFLIREFSEYWKRKQDEVADSDPGFIAMRKIEPKIQEIGQYGRFSENGISLKYRSWYVSKEIRKKYGLEDLSLNNSWHYTLPVKEWKYDSKEEKADEHEDSPSSKSQTKSNFTGTNLITKFTKVLNAEEDKKKLFSIGSNNEPQSRCLKDASVSPDNLNLKSPNTSDMVSTTPCSSGRKERKKANLTAITREKTENSRGNKSIVTMFKNIGKEKKTSDKKSLENKDQQLECITLE